MNKQTLTKAVEDAQASRNLDELRRAVVNIGLALVQVAAEAGVSKDYKEGIRQALLNNVERHLNK